MSTAQGGRRSRLGEFIRLRRIELGISQAQMARAIGVTPPFLQDLEGGRRGTRRLPMIALALDVDLSTLRELDLRVTDELIEWLERNPDRLRQLHAEKEKEDQ